MCIADQCHTCIYRFVLRDRAAHTADGKRLSDRGFGRDVFGEFEMDRAGTLLGRNAERLAHQGRDAHPINNRCAEFCDGLENVERVDDLEVAMHAALDGFLSRDNDHRHTAQIRECGARDKVRDARPERGKTDAGPTGQTAICCRHKSGRLLVARYDKPDARIAQRLKEVEIFFAWKTKDCVDPFVFKASDKEVGRF